ncbi:translation factor waclaw isoform X2 [Oratosquilla oratoria]|uniref:translation factor waclaw isoform X2 n=1 Tax=Oratosquilla oratoria TaxID=337810 RepID=UPI003F768505
MKRSGCSSYQFLRIWKAGSLARLARGGYPYSDHASSKETDAGSRFPDISSFPLERIRNFSIIAHVDHGKSTLADRLLELTGAIQRDGTNKQVLDKLQVERERGITVKAQSASVIYNHKGQDYLINLIDTPGHVDFSYEVSRSLAACQGVILLVDANEGVQAQTVANFYLAFSADLVILPVINKIDLKNARPEEVIEQMKNMFEFEPETVLKISAKNNIGIESVLEAVIEKIPSPVGFCRNDVSLRMLVFDSWYDRYKGAVCLALVVDGCLSKGNLITSTFTGKSYEVKELGILTPNEIPVSRICAGQVGYFMANIRSTKEAQVGDTFFLKGTNVNPVSGVHPPKPMVYAGVYPLDQGEYPALSSAIGRLTLNDSSVSISKESSPALGQGWHLGFLGLLHMEVFNQRLEQEYGAQVVVTTPSVPYKVLIKGEKARREYGGAEILVNNPVKWPDPLIISDVQEPMVIGTIITPDIYLGPVMRLCQDCRSVQQDMQNLDSSRVLIQYKMPLNEIIVNFFDQLKCHTSGYASFDYEEIGYESSYLEKMSILLNGSVVEELSVIVHASRARAVGKRMCAKLKDAIPRQMFQIAIQAAVRGKILARENIKPLRKDVAAKLYGGDITRRMKLLKYQSDGKKRMKMIGNIEVPRNTFISILKK